MLRAKRPAPIFCKMPLEFPYFLCYCTSQVRVRNFCPKRLLRRFFYFGHRNSSAIVTGNPSLAGSHPGRRPLRRYGVRRFTLSLEGLPLVFHSRPSPIPSSGIRATVPKAVAKTLPSCVPSCRILSLRTSWSRTHLESTLIEMSQKRTSNYF